MCLSGIIYIYTTYTYLIHLCTYTNQLNISGGNMLVDWRVLYIYLAVSFQWAECGIGGSPPPTGCGQECCQDCSTLLCQVWTAGVYWIVCMIVCLWSIWIKECFHTQNFNPGLVHRHYIFQTYYLFRYCWDTICHSLISWFIYKDLSVKASSGCSKTCCCTTHHVINLTHYEW